MNISYGEKISKNIEEMFQMNKLYELSEDVFLENGGVILKPEDDVDTEELFEDWEEAMRQNDADAKKGEEF